MGFFLKSGVVGDSLHVLSSLNALRTVSTILYFKAINDGIIKNYSIGGRVLNDSITTQIKKDGTKLEVINDLEIFEVTLCSRGVNPLAKFDIVKGDELVTPGKGFSMKKFFSFVEYYSNKY